MKLLLLALFCFPLFAQDFEKAKLSDFSQEVVADAQLKKLAVKEKKGVTDCAKYNFSINSKAYCEAEYIKQFQEEIKQRVQLIVQSTLNEALDKLLADEDELRCTSVLRLKLEKLNIAYETSDTCDILKGKFK